MPSSGRRVAETGLFGILVLAWGLNYLFVRAGLSYSPPLWLAAGRTVVGLVVITLVLAARGPSGAPLDSRGRRDAILLGLPTSAVFFGLWFVGELSVLPGEAAVIVYTFPLWVALLAHPVLGRRVTSPVAATILLGFAGIVGITQPWAAGDGGLAIPAVVELLLAAISWAVGTVVFQRRFPGPQMQEANAYQLLGGSIALVAASVVFEPRLPPVSVDLLLILLWLGAVGTALAYAIWFWLLASVPAESLAAYVFLVPVVALAFSSALLGERIDLVQGVGVAAVVVSLYLTGTRGGAARIGTV